MNFVNQAIAQTRAAVPAALSIVAVIVNPNREPVLSYALTSNDLSQAVLRDIATTQIVSQLYGVPGLGALLVTGGPAKEFHVTLDPAQLAAQGIGAADVSRALADANRVEGVGVAQKYDQKVAVLIDSSLRDRESLAAVQVPDEERRFRAARESRHDFPRRVPGDGPNFDRRPSRRHPQRVRVLPGADTVKLAEAFRARLTTGSCRICRAISP